MKKKRILITGTIGLLGQALLKKKKSNTIIIPTRHKNKDLSEEYIFLDITDKKNVEEVFKRVNPDIVIHAASIGNVDYCEKNSQDAYLVNVTGTKNITQFCIKYKAKLIFISSNAVFNGKNPPYNEESLTKPLNYYGKTKVMGEKIVSKAPIDSAIVRLILMYGWNHPKGRENPVTWLVKKLEDKQKIKLVNDTYTNPVHSSQAAEAIWRIIKLNKKGIYHIAGKNRMNRYQFGLEVADAWGHDRDQIEAVDSSFFSGFAQRMPDTTFDLTKMKKELHMRPMSVKEGLIKMRREKNL